MSERCVWTAQRKRIANDDFCTHFATAALGVTGSPYLIRVSYAGVSVAVPRNLAVGIKRIKSSAASKVALLGVTLLRLVQIVPPSVEYSQVPLVAPVTPLTAMPSVAPGASKYLPKTLATMSPAAAVTLLYQSQ